MSITEKELAEKLAGIYGDINDYDWPTVARTAAELLGVTLAPEKPEPGTALMNVQTSRGGNRWDVGVIRGDGQVDVYMQGGPSSTYTWDQVVDYQPARVVPEADYLRLVNLRADEDRNPADAQYAPAEPVELTEEDLEAAYPHDEPNAYGMLTLDAFGAADRRALVRMCQTLVDKHGHGRAAVTREQVREAVATALEKYHYMPTDEIADTTDHVMAALGGDRG